MYDTFLILRCVQWFKDTKLKANHNIWGYVTDRF